MARQPPTFSLISEFKWQCKLHCFECLEVIFFTFINFVRKKEALGSTFVLLVIHLCMAKKVLSFNCECHFLFFEIKMNSTYLLTESKKKKKYINAMR